MLELPLLPYQSYNPATKEVRIETEEIIILPPNPKPKRINRTKAKDNKKDNNGDDDDDDDQDNDGQGVRDYYASDELRRARLEEHHRNKHEDQDKICCENPFPQEFARDCTYVITMFMNAIYLGMSAFFLFCSYNVTYHDVNLHSLTNWFTVVVIIFCVLCFLADSIICCKLDIHSFIDTCPLTFWIICNSTFVLLNIIQLTLISIVYWTLYKEHEELKSKGTIPISKFGHSSFLGSAMSLLVIGTTFLLIRIWFIFIVNHMRRVLARKYPVNRPWPSEDTIDDDFDYLHQYL